MATTARISPARIELDRRELAATLRRIEAITRLMDSAVAVPGTNIRLGLDAVLGLVPVIGDVASQLVSVYLVTEARRLRVPRWVLARMIANTMIDTVLGSIPLLGDVFDVYFRANVRNLALLREHLRRSGEIV